MTEHDALQRTLRTFYAQWSVAWAKTHSNATTLSRAASADTERFVTESIAEIAHVLALTAKPAGRPQKVVYWLEFEHAPVTITLYDTHQTRQMDHPDTSYKPDRMQCADAERRFAADIAGTLPGAEQEDQSSRETNRKRECRS